MKPAEFRRQMARIAHPQGAQRFEAEYGKALVPDANFPESETPAPNPEIQPAPSSQRDVRVKNPTKDSFVVATLCGSCPTMYTLSLFIETDHDALATGSLQPVGPHFTEGTTVIATAVPSTGYHFVVWEIYPEGLTSTDNPLSVKMDANKVITARIEAD